MNLPNVPTTTKACWHLACTSHYPTHDTDCRTHHAGSKIPIAHSATASGQTQPASRPSQLPQCPHPIRVCEQSLSSTLSTMHAARESPEPRRSTVKTVKESLRHGSSSSPACAGRMPRRLPSPAWTPSPTGGFSPGCPSPIGGGGAAALFKRPGTKLLTASGAPSAIGVVLVGRILCMLWPLVGVCHANFNLGAPARSGAGGPQLCSRGLG